MWWLLYKNWFQAKFCFCQSYSLTNRTTLLTTIYHDNWPSPNPNVLGEYRAFGPFIVVPILMEGLLGNFQPRKRLLTNLKKNNFLEQDQTTLIYCSAPKNFFIPRANMGVWHLDRNSARWRHTKILKWIIILSSFVYAFLKETFSLKVI